MIEPAGVYVHFPFCAIRCSYCDFATVAGRDERIEAYLRALEIEIASFQHEAPAEVDSIFLGGGTPSRLPPDSVARLLAALGRRFRLAPDTEVTIEANPESLSPRRLDGYRRAGITRISIGVQSLDDGVLRSVGRAHDAALAERAIVLARGVGFASVSADLIAGLPGEDLAEWPRTLARIVELGVDHLSVYLLETDKDTPLGRAVRGGRVRAADEDALAACYRRGVETLRRAGFEHYEISNFARRGHRSRHNVKYWRDVPYAGFGLGAHAYLGGERRANRRDLDGYLADLEAGRDPLAEREPRDARRRLEEALMLGLRLIEGVDLAALADRYGIDPARCFAGAWERAEQAAVLERRGSRIRLTDRGRLCSNELFAELVGGGARVAGVT